MAKIHFKVGTELLGEGNYGLVYRGSMWKDEKEIEVAIKKVMYEETKFDQIKKEYDFLKQVQEHENIITTYGLEKDESIVYIILELCEMDLEKYLKTEKPTLQQKIEIMHQSASAISFMHNLQPAIVHRDVKPGNILIRRKQEGLVAKITDFGFARMFDPDGSKRYMNSKVGTPMYLAPEQFDSREGINYTAAVDVFSLGLVYLVIMTCDDNPRLEPNPEILRKEDLLPYAQHLLNSKSYNKPMPVMFTLTAEDMWPVGQIKLIINQMAGFDAKHRIPMATVHQELSAIVSVNMQDTYYPSSITALKKENEDIVHLLVLKGEENANLSKERDKYSKEINALKLQLRKKDDQIQQKDHIIHESEVTAAVKDEIIQMLESEVASKRMTLHSNTSQESVIGKEATSPHSKSVQVECQENTISIKSFRHTNLWPLKPSFISSLWNLPNFSSLSGKPNVSHVKDVKCDKEFQIKHSCERMYCVNSSIYCPCPGDNSLLIYSLNGDCMKHISMYTITSPRAVHPLSEGRLVLAAGSGLYVVDYEGSIVCQIMEGDFRDVHISDHLIAAIENYPEKSDESDAGADTHKSGLLDRSDRIHILSNTAPYLQSAVFSVGHTQALSVLLSENASTVCVSDRAGHHITTYSLSGRQISQAGRPGHEQTGKLYRPYLCATDSSGQVLICDWGNSRLQLLSAGKWAVLPMVQLRQPTDLFIHYNHLYVLHHFDVISVFKIA